MIEPPTAIAVYIFFFVMTTIRLEDQDDENDDNDAAPCDHQDDGGPTTTMTMMIMMCGSEAALALAVKFQNRPRKSGFKTESIQTGPGLLFGLQRLQRQYREDDFHCDRSLSAEPYPFESHSPTKTKIETRWLPQSVCVLGHRSSKQRGACRVGCESSAKRLTGYKDATMTTVCSWHQAGIASASIATSTMTGIIILKNVARATTVAITCCARIIIKTYLLCTTNGTIPAMKVAVRIRTVTIGTSSTGNTAFATISLMFAYPFFSSCLECYWSDTISYPDDYLTSVT